MVYDREDMKALQRNETNVLPKYLGRTIMTVHEMESLGRAESCGSSLSSLVQERVIALLLRRHRCS